MFTHHRAPTLNIYLFLLIFNSRNLDVLMFDWAASFSPRGRPRNFGPTMPASEVYIYAWNTSSCRGVSSSGILLVACIFSPFPHFFIRRPFRSRGSRQSDHCRTAWHHSTPHSPGELLGEYFLFHFPQQQPTPRHAGYVGSKHVITCTCYLKHIDSILVRLENHRGCEIV